MGLALWCPNAEYPFACPSRSSHSLLLLRLCLLLAPVSGLQRCHSRLADVRIPQVKGLEVMRLNDRRELDLAVPLLL